MDVMQLLEFAVKQGASDVHLSAGEPPMIRVHGVMKKLNVPPLTRETAHSMIFDIMNDNQQKIFQERLETDFSIELPGGESRFRVNAFTQRRGEAAVHRAHHDVYQEERDREVEALLRLFDYQRQQEGSVARINE